MEWQILQIIYWAASDASSGSSLHFLCHLNFKILQLLKKKNDYNVLLVINHYHWAAVAEEVQQLIH